MNKIEEYLARKPPLQTATVGYFMQGDKVLLGFRTRVSNNLGVDIYGGIGGKNKPGETNDESLSREIKEEICVTVLRWRWIGQVDFLFPDASKNQSVAIAIVDAWDGKPTKTAVITPRWFPKDALPNNMWPDSIYVMPLVLAYEPCKEFTGAFLYNEAGAIAEHYLHLQQPHQAA
jgi:ADP-ribose pyrophosphatase YjhB (NUDIX family)